MKKIEWIDGNQMRIDTPHKKFNKQTTAISTGNVMGGTQTSTYVRDYNETVNPVGQTVSTGILQEFDIKTFSSDYVGYSSLTMLERGKRAIRELTRNRSVIAYCFFHWNKEHDPLGGSENKKFIHGWVITDTDHRHLRTIYRSTHKSFEIVDECRRYVCSNYDEAGNLVEPLLVEAGAA